MNQQVGAVGNHLRIADRDAMRLRHLLGGANRAYAECVHAIPFLKASQQAGELAAKFTKIVR
jgi:hypothetical protein